MADLGLPQRSGTEAAAILLMVLAEEEAAEVLSRLEPDEVQALGASMFAVAGTRWWPWSSTIAWRGRGRPRPSASAPTARSGA